MPAASSNAAVRCFCSCFAFGDNVAIRIYLMVTPCNSDVLQAELPSGERASQKASRRSAPSSFTPSRLHAILRACTRGTAIPPRPSSLRRGILLRTSGCFHLCELLGGILQRRPESITVANAATGATMLWLLFFLLPVFTGLTFIVIDRRRGRLRDYDEDIGP